MNSVKECLLIQREQEKFDLIRKAKKDMLEEISLELNDVEALLLKIKNLLLDEDLKKEIEEQKKAPKINNLTEQKKKEPFSKKEKAIHKEYLNTFSKKKDETLDFEYTLEQIEKKLDDLRRS